MSLQSSTRAFVCTRCQLRNFLQTRSNTTTALQTGAQLSTAIRRYNTGTGLVLPFGKTQGRQRRKVREASEPLEIQSLGAPSEVIVLRDTNTKQPANNLDVLPKDNGSIKYQGLSKDDILGLIKQEKAAPGQEQINSQLDSLKPPATVGLRDARYLTREEYESLSKTVHDGFTAPQLARYIEINEGVRKLEKIEGLESKTDAQTESKKIIGRSPWKPGETSIEWRISAASLQKQVSRSPGKKKLTEKLLREYWNINVLEEIESNGELELRLKSWHLELLRTDMSKLDKISSNRKVKIEVYLPEHILRITADKQSAEYAAEDIQTVILNSELLRFDLAPFGSKARKVPAELTKEDVASAAKLSQTIIQPIKDGALLIRAMTKNAAEDARSCLLQMLGTSEATRSKALAQGTKEGVLIATHPGELLSYTDRRKSLVRWVTPLARLSTQPKAILGQDVSENKPHTANEPNDTLRPAAESDLRNEVVRFLNTPVYAAHLVNKCLSESSVQQPDPKSLWSGAPVTETFALIGQVLHTRKGTQLETCTREKPPLGQNWQRVFSSNVPGLPHFLHTMDSDLAVDEFLTFRFVPSPWAESFSSFPKLLLRMSVEPENQFTVRGFGASIGERATDVLLPSLATDIRFLRREVIWARNVDSDKTIAAFFGAIQETLASGDRIRAPGLLKVSIPTWAIRTHSRTEAQITDEWKSHKEVEMDYVFAGVEHRQSFRLSYQDESLSYTGVEAGALGGRRGELRLRTSRIRETTAWEEQHANMVPDFVDAAFSLAEEISRSSSNLLALDELHS